jgi:hypothetical protein
MKLDGISNSANLNFDIPNRKLDNVGKKYQVHASFILFERNTSLFGVPIVES